MRRVVVAAVAACIALVSVPGLSAQSGGLVEEVALDNDSVRVALLTIPAGASSRIHLNAEPELGIVVEGELTLVTRAGKERLPAGRVVFLPPVTGHDARNESGRVVKVWTLNLKRCD
jgi:quercetin dioxygenase-like cupin family protein